MTATEQAMNELGQLIGQFLAVPLGFATILLVTGLLLCVGAVTVLRWCGARLSRLTRRQSLQAAQVLAWQNTPKIAQASSSYVHSDRADPFPIRRDRGPRDW